MSLAVATPHYGFGFRANVSGSLRFCDEQTLLFPAGNQIARFNLEQKHMRFIGGSENAQNITAMAISPNNRFLVLPSIFFKTVLDIFYTKIFSPKDSILNF